MTANQNANQGRCRAPGRRIVSAGLIPAILMCGRAQVLMGQKQQKIYVPPQPVQTTPAQQKPSSVSGHGPVTKQGPNVGGLSGGEDAAIAVTTVGLAATLVYVFHHHNAKLPNPEQLGSQGPNVPKSFDMNHFVVQGYIGPNWPVGLDFTLSGPGAVKLDITTADGSVYPEVLTNDLHGRGIAIVNPPGLPDKVQVASFDVEAIPPPGSTGPAPNLRVYGLAAGPNAVGSIAIDEVGFGPSNIRIKESAAYDYHAHSSFSSVRADVIYTFAKDTHIFMKQESEDDAGPVAQGARSQGTWVSKGNAGQHMLQLRAWRGYQGDWVVAWSPDIVYVTK